MAACGNVAGFALHTTVLPFILRGINLLGINSLDEPLERRRVAWTRLAATLPVSMIKEIMQIVDLGEVPEVAAQILEGKVRGRIVVKVQPE